MVPALYYIVYGVTTSLRCVVLLLRTVTQYGGVKWSLHTQYNTTQGL
jgi:hypothetical protein